MKIKFYSFTPSGNVKFETSGEYKNDCLIFNDESSSNTKINLICNNDGIEFKRVGDTKTEMYLKIGRKTLGHYKKDDLEFNFYTFTKKIEILDDKITAIYEMIMNDLSLGLYKIFIVKK